MHRPSHFAADFFKSDFAPLAKMCSTSVLKNLCFFASPKLQDAVGKRLIPATLAVLREPFEEWPMRDQLNRLEKLGYLNVGDWLAWRKIRNRLAHEYPDLPEVGFAALVAAIDAARSLAALCQDWQNRLDTL